MAQRYATADDLPDEFAGAPPNDVSLWLGVCEQFIDLSAWGEKASVGHALITAHYLKRNGFGTGPSGRAVQSRKVGDVSVTYQPAIITQDVHFELTSYGVAFRELRKGVRPGPMAVRSNTVPVLAR